MEKRAEAAKAYSRTGLLVSVRSAEEAEAALAGGATLIDVKEPARGSLGRADDSILDAVVAVVAGRRPVSAACGELMDRPRSLSTQRASLLPTYQKWGLAACAGLSNWQNLLEDRAAEMPVGCQLVAVAYADWDRAMAPAPEAVCACACERRWGAFLIDTCVKDGKSLLDLLSLQRIESLVNRCRLAGVPIALAGALDEARIRDLLPLQPDWFAVRGAACANRDRRAQVKASRVRRLARLVQSELV
jgi:uncharacterized protein (UPF0264 family)